MHVDLTLPQYSDRVLRCSACCLACFKPAHVHWAALGRLVWLHLLAHQAWVQALRHLLALGSSILVGHVPASVDADLLQVLELHGLEVSFFLLLLTPRLLASMSSGVPSGSRGRLLCQIIGSHVLGRLLELPVADPLLIGVHLVLLAAEVYLVLVDD